MFGKLMKYELRYLVRIFAPMWGLMLAMCGLARVSAWNFYSDGTEVVSVLILMAAWMAFVAMVIISEVVIIVRFYKGMYGDEGYLMFTLPVTNSQLIHSKGLSAAIMWFATILVSILGGMILASYGELWTEIGELISELFAYEYLTAAKFGLIVFWFVVTLITGLFNSVYAIYLAISIGQLWRKHPVAGGILAYYGISMVLSGLMQAVMMPLMINLDEAWFINLDVGMAIIVILIGGALLNAVLTLLYYVVTKLLMDRRLNIA